MMPVQLHLQVTFAATFLAEIIQRQIKILCVLFSWNTVLSNCVEFRLETVGNKIQSITLERQ